MRSGNSDFRSLWSARKNLKINFLANSTPHAKIAEICTGKLYLNFDDDAFDAEMQQFLAELFPTPCCYEAPKP